MGARHKCTYKEMNVDLITSFDLWQPHSLCHCGGWALEEEETKSSELAGQGYTDNQFMTIPRSSCKSPYVTLSWPQLAQQLTSAWLL